MAAPDLWRVSHIFECEVDVTLDEARAKSKAIWDEMAGGWERRLDYIWEASRPVGEWMVSKLDPQPGQTLLDIAAGPGQTGFVAARIIGDKGKLISTDFAPEMLEVARRQAKKLGLSNVEFRIMDAEKMDLPDDSVDGVLCRWGFMLMIDPAAAFIQTRRVLRSGGRLAFSVWGPPAENPWATLPGMVMVQLGKLEMPDPDAPGGLFSLAEEARIEELVTGAGFGEVEIEPMPVTWRYADFEELWGFINDLAGAIAQVLRTLDEKGIDDVRKALRTQAESFRTGDGYAFPGLTLNAIAQ